MVFCFTKRSSFTTGQMETDIVGTLLAGSLVAQVGEDKAVHGFRLMISPLLQLQLVGGFKHFLLKLCSTNLG